MLCALFSRLGNKILHLKLLALQYMPTISLIKLLPPSTAFQEKHWKGFYFSSGGKRVKGGALWTGTKTQKKGK